MTPIVPQKRETRAEISARRAAIVRVSPDALELWLRGQAQPTWTSAPADLEVIGVEWDFVGRCLKVYCLSSTFALIPNFEQTPELEILIRREPPA